MRNQIHRSITAIIQRTIKIRFAYSPKADWHVVRESSLAIPNYRGCFFRHRSKHVCIFIASGAACCILGLKLKLKFDQPRYVTLATSIFTGLHGMCLLVVTTWFIYQLKYESAWAEWFRTAIRPIIAYTGLNIVLIMGWVKTGMKCVITFTKVGILWLWSPYENYRRNFHLRRNIFWYAHCLIYPRSKLTLCTRAFGLDNHVARLNHDVVLNWDYESSNWTTFQPSSFVFADLDQGWKFDWPEPYLLSKIIRHVVYPIKKGWIAIMLTLYCLGPAIRKHMCVFSRTYHTEGQVESRKREGQEDTEVSENTPKTSAEKAKDEFRIFLLTVFSEVNTVNGIMAYVDEWESGS